MTTDEIDEVTKEMVSDLTTNSRWALITTGLRIFAIALLNAGTLNTRFRQTLYPSFSR